MSYLLIVFFSERELMFTFAICRFTFCCERVLGVATSLTTRSSARSSSLTSDLFVVRSIIVLFVLSVYVYSLLSTIAPLIRSRLTALYKFVFD